MKAAASLAGWLVVLPGLVYAQVAGGSPDRASFEAVLGQEMGTGSLVTTADLARISRYLPNRSYQFVEQGKVPLHRSGFDPIQDTAAYFKQGVAYNPTTVVSPAGSCFGLCLASASWYATLWQRLDDPGRQDLLRAALPSQHWPPPGQIPGAPSPLVRFAESTGLAALMPPSVAAGSLPQHRMRSFTTHGNFPDPRRATELAKLAASFNVLQMEDPLYAGVDQAWAVREEFPQAPQLLAAILADLANPAAGTHAIALPGTRFKEGRLIAHALLACRAWKGEARSYLEIAGSLQEVRVPAISIDLVDPNFAPGEGQPDASLLYFTRSGRFAWPRSDWTAVYGRLVAGGAGDVPAEQGAKLWETSEGLVIPFGVGTWDIHLDRTARRRTDMFRNQLGSPEEFIGRAMLSDERAAREYRRPRTGSPAYPTGSGPGPSPLPPAVLEVVDVDAYIRAEFDIP